MTVPSRISNPWCPRAKPDRLPKISIITPNYNYAHFLEATLRSVLEQGYPNLEYIVMDDGSTDDSIRVIEQYADKLTYWQTAPNQGQYKAITAGFARATGDVMGWINSDDMHLPWTLWAVADIFSCFPEIEWISTLCPGAWDHEGLCLNFEHLNGFSHEAFLDGLYIPGPVAGRANVPRRRVYIQQESTFWRRSLWDKAGGFVSANYGSAGDYELWGRFFESGGCLVGVSTPLAGFRFQNQQQTVQIEKYAALCQTLLGKFRDRAGWRPKPIRNCLQLNCPWAWSLPKIGIQLQKRYGYTGLTLTRASRNTANAQWTLEPHAFA